MGNDIVLFAKKIFFFFIVKTVNVFKLVSLLNILFIFIVVIFLCSIRKLVIEHFSFYITLKCVRMCFGPFCIFGAWD